MYNLYVICYIRQTNMYLCNVMFLSIVKQLIIEIHRFYTKKYKDSLKYTSGPFVYIKFNFKIFIHIYIYISNYI